METETQRIGREILERIPPRTTSLFRKEWWQGQILDRCMSDEALKVGLFRFVDVLPNLKEAWDVVRLFREYLDRPDTAPLPFLSWGMKTLVRGSPTVPLAAAAIRKNVASLAESFIAGATLEEALPTLDAIRKAGGFWCVSMLGEVAVNEEESAAYQTLYLETIRQLGRIGSIGVAGAGSVDADRFGALPSASLAVKLSSLYSQMDPLDWEGSLQVLSQRLETLLIAAREAGVHLHLDMEHYAFKDLILQTFFRTVKRLPSANGRDVGIVIQAYLKDSGEDLENVLAWAEKYRRGITVRLVRGAYWDSETVIHRQQGWPVPVYLSKAETDANFEALTRRLFAASDTVRAAIGSHNVRSMAHAWAAARAAGLSNKEFEIQMLYGMGEPLRTALTGMGLRVRMYTPVGALIPGMAYLVRRLIENTSNESFLTNLLVAPKSPEEVLAPPDPKPTPEVPVEGFHNEPLLDFRRAEVRADFGMALEAVRAELGRNYPVRIDGRDVETTEWMASVNPARPAEVVGQSASAGEDEAERAIAAAQRVAGAWSERPISERADLLRRVADRMRQRRMELAAWEVFEVGKSWREADGDITESIDFLRYYAGEIERLALPRRMGGYPGEINLYSYSPIGIGAVIAPWNFPLAIPTGMVAAALAAGNAVMFKPSELSPVMGRHLVDLFEEAGLPAGVLAFLPGRGERVGEHLVRHPKIGFIAFTGSREVGLSIVAKAAHVVPGQRQIKRVIAEMGGKNAILVDETADLDLAVLGVVQSAVGFQGQKCSACSRVVVLEGVYDTFLHRLAGAVRSLKIGLPEDPGTHLGPVVEEAAKGRLERAIEAGAKEGRLMVRITDVPSEGFFVGPAVIADVSPGCRLAQEELFGPVLAVIRAKDLDEAIAFVNATDDALTAGMFSRSPSAIARFTREAEAGNLYINRGITGALVGRQPFGGYRLSGIGSKAGGPDYLLQFMVPKVVSENTVRRGFAPSDPPSGRTE